MHIRGRGLEQRLRLKAYPQIEFTNLKNIWSSLQYGNENIYEKKYNADVQIIYRRPNIVS